MKRNEKRDLRRLAFLDTNVLHYLGLYFKMVPDELRYPALDVIEQDDADGEISRVERQSFKRATEFIESEKENGEKGLWNSVGMGLMAVKFLREGRGGTPYEVEYAQVSELELMEGKVRGAVVEQFAAEGAPQRMWTARFQDRELEERVGAGARERIWQEIEGLSRTLGDLGIRVADTRSGPSRDVLDLAWGVMRVVHFSVCDAIVYAGALRSSAVCVVTADEHLWRVVRGVKEAASGSGGAAYREAAKEIQRMSVGEEEKEAILPDGHRIRPIKRPKERQR